MILRTLSTGQLFLRQSFHTVPLPGWGVAAQALNIAFDAREVGPFPIRCWILEIKDRLVLIDAGYRNGMSGGLTRTRFDVKPEQELLPSLERLGYRLNNLTHMVMTHLHVDHVGGLFDFEGRMMVARKEWDSVRHLPPPMHDMMAPVPKSFHPELFDFSDSGYGPFPQVFDVFGDGSLLGLPTPGHSAGHTSYLVWLDGKPVLLAGDVTYDRASLEAQRFQGMVIANRVHRETLARVRELASTMPYLASHDTDEGYRRQGLVVQNNTVVST